MQGLRRNSRWRGQPQINSRVGWELFHAINAMAGERKIGASGLVKEILTEAYRSGKLKVVEATPPETMIPTTKQTRMDTGRSETIRALQAVDAARSQAKDAGSAFND